VIRSIHLDDPRHCLFLKLKNHGIAQAGNLILTSRIMPQHAGRDKREPALGSAFPSWRHEVRVSP
jgi:hypothetical protein